MWRKILHVSVTFEHNLELSKGDMWCLRKEHSRKPRAESKRIFGMSEEEKQRSWGRVREVGDEVRKAADANSNSYKLWQGLLALILA
jgi:hypothetical protein